MHFAHTAAAIMLALSTKALADQTLRQKLDRRGASQFAIHIENRAGPGYYIDWANNPNVPDSITNVGSGPLGSSAVGVYPAGWAGRIMVGKSNDPAVLNRGSMIEASFIDGFSSFDVSYIEGYSVPIVCSCEGVVVAGCNNALEETGIECPEPGPTDTCYNPLRSSNQAPGTQAHSFFQSCQGNAMTYPQDFLPGTIPHCDDSAIFCCVGSDCPSNKYQPQKRSLGDEIPTGLDDEFDDDFAEEEDTDLNARNFIDNSESFPDANITDVDWEEEIGKRTLEEDVFNGSYYDDSDYDDEIEQRSVDDEYADEVYDGTVDDFPEDSDTDLVDKRDIPVLDSFEPIDEVNSYAGDENDRYTTYENAQWDEVVGKRFIEEDIYNFYDEDESEYDDSIEQRSTNDENFPTFNYHDSESDDSINQHSPDADYFPSSTYL